MIFETPSQPIVKDSIPSIVEEPPLKDRRSCLRRGCSFTLGLALLLIVALIVITIFFQKPRPVNLATLPPNFPLNVPLYRFVDRTVINYFPAEKKDRLLERLARHAPDPKKWRDLPQLLSAPSAQRDIDTVEIVWQNLNTSLREVENFYRKNLTAEDFTIGVLKREPTRLVIIFNKGEVTGSLHIEEPQRKGVSTVVLRADYKIK